MYSDLWQTLICAYPQDNEEVFYWLITLLQLAILLIPMLVGGWFLILRKERQFKKAEEYEDLFFHNFTFLQEVLLPVFLKAALNKSIFTMYSTNK